MPLQSRFLLGPAGCFLRQCHTGLAPNPKTCCTNEETGQRQPACGLTGCAYRVLYNCGRLLSLEFDLEFTGAYSWNSVRHAVFDLQTGKKAGITDILAGSPARMRQQLRLAISHHVAKALADCFETEQDSSLVAELTERFHWNIKTQQVESAEESSSILNYFSVSGMELLFSTDPGCHVLYGSIVLKQPAAFHMKQCSLKLYGRGCEQDNNILYICT